MASPTAIAAYVSLFALVGFVFLFSNLVLGWLVRPRLPNVEKLEVYECGEPTIGSSFVQFDLRFYVVALLFIIFEVEVAFFFPWATVYGKVTQLAAGPPAALAASDTNNEVPSATAATLSELGLPNVPAADNAELREDARVLAKTSIADILVFFGVLLVGFAYVWKRGDLDWVRALAREKPQPAHRPPTPRALEPSQSILSA
ncbi:MAG TPA: NADH-quinone oxidoreductase subunit A [Lacipirellulaceae bacterium]|jgi:NADH-quinone oxidoreductase subunit A|nr:NADH-quinone oxidoreductase subunit A [Lacipirellulaceae bacterium]